MGKTARSSLLSLVVAIGLGCGGNPAPPKTQEMVPANSSNEPAPKDASTTTSGANDPTSGGSGSGGTATGAMPERIGGDPATTPAPSSSATGAIGATAPGAGGPKVTKAECKKVLDKYVDLAIAADPNLAGLPPDVIKQAFAQAASQSANPCEGDGVSRNQYKCAMKATSADKWQACMK